MIPNNTYKTLVAFRDYVVLRAKNNLRGKDNTGALANSLDNSKVIVSQNSFQLDFTMEQYGLFQDKGVKGKTSSNKAPNSPYRFGSGSGKKGGLTEGINKWVRQKGFQFRQKEGKGTKGQFLSYKQTAYLITRSIYHKGMKPTLFFTKPFKEGYDKYITKELEEAFGLDIEELLKFSLKDIK